MDFKYFGTFLVLRLATLFATLCLTAWLLVNSKFYVTCILLFAATLVQAVGLYRHILRTNRDVIRFLDAMRYADYTQEFPNHHLGSGFDELGRFFASNLTHFQKLQHQQEKKIIYLRALIDHAPVPLISLYDGGDIAIHNNSARRLFGSTRVSHIDHLEKFGTQLKETILTLKAGENKSAVFSNDKKTKTLALKATQVIVTHRFENPTQRSEKLISLLDIQTELETMQIKAWQDLVSVLTHEIMNSLTPISSLANTSKELVKELLDKQVHCQAQEHDLNDIYSGVVVLARRSESLMTFVQNYRRLTHLPSLQKKMIRIVDLLNHVIELISVKWANKNIQYKLETISNELKIDADPEMIEQILINVLQNAEQALSETQHPHVCIQVRLSYSGKVVVDISDNGPGIATDIATKIFVPFFTTKPNGSGIGLALTQQIMHAHGGTITHMRNSDGGATFSLTF